MVPKLGYLQAASVPLMGRGATAFSPAFSMVPFSSYNGFNFGSTPRGSTPLTLTTMNLASLGLAPGFSYTAPAAGFVLGGNIYTAPGAS